MNNPIMACGCAATSIFTIIDGKPVDPPVRGCGVHKCTEIAADKPDLTGRQARCGCGRIEPSDPDHLAFFEYTGPGSREATDTCECGYAKVAHDEDRITCKRGGFTARGPREFDRFYCGHSGWD